MAIKRITVSNFKSFRHLDIDLQNFNVLIGKNASGKSNFVEIFSFLKDIVDHGLGNALSMHGGNKFVTNTQIGSSEMLYFHIELAGKFRLPVLPSVDNALGFGMEGSEMSYTFALKLHQRGGGFSIRHDEFTAHLEVFKLEPGADDEKDRPPKLGAGEITIKRGGKKVSVDISETLKSGDLASAYWPLLHAGLNILPTGLLIENPFLFALPFMQEVGEIATYDIDPKLPKKAFPITGKLDLEQDGENLAIVLKNIVGDKNRKRKFSNLLKDLLPFVDDMNVEKFGDKSLLFKLRESYSKNDYLPASMISDGTIHLTALIVALYFSKEGLTIIEEPERNIHPALLSKVAAMLKEVSEKKQLIVTTHSPGLVRSADLHSILFVSRDKNGFSTVTRPADMEHVQTFLKNEIGIDDLFAQDLLGV